MTSIKGRLRECGAFVAIYSLAHSLPSQYGANIFHWIPRVAGYVRDYFRYLRQGPNRNFETSLRHLYPCLRDKTADTPIEPIYFYQDVWAAGKIFQIRPSHHYDVGSSAKTIGIISQFVPTTMVDIRPVDVVLDNFHFQAGSILSLPFRDESIESLSSLCVVEHIGLGRYGDELDPWGSENAVQELKRVLKKGGHLLVSVPVDTASRVYFNAHRAFTREKVLEMMGGMVLAEERYIYGRRLQDCYDAAQGFGTGLFHFVKQP